MAGEPAAAILTCAFVSRVDVIAAESHLALRYPVIADEKNNPGNPNNAVDQPNGIIMSRHRQLAPAFKIKGLILLVYGSGNSLIKEDKSPSNRCHMDREVGAVKDENFGVEDGIPRNCDGMVH